ncbi:1-acyl-sn-glycerol-3-phosphate acyltransferase [Mangrovicoccus sp. HB161399]|uniref:lysophospholipid acyltransferase family protein n=1 Tax=Mangrovicoccus sp. HB161399 TaxID=2720392 RepID=UPI0015529FB2|nr:lysophospholipid acyltransferase family protein [Mangrovicoccus sp. HB161399]
MPDASVREAALPQSRGTGRPVPARARSALFDGLFALWTLVLGLLIPGLALLRRPALTRAAIRVWTDGTFALMRAVLGLRFREEGLENKHPGGPCIYVANHQSTWETLAFNRLVPEICMVAKHELRRIPVFGWYLGNAPMILVDRGAGGRALAAMITEARREVAAGRSILIFPEGTRTDVGDSCKFQPGLIALYRKLGIPVVPVAHNAGCFWRRNVKAAGTVTLSYLPAVPAGLPAAEAMAEVESLLTAEKDRLARKAR